jgi:NAD(P)-dependent dehydrogenase (short-subunit alcohol dehydrogenase family)
VAQRLLNKVAVVTGAGSGIGRAVAEQMLAEGAKVVLFGRRGALLDDVAARAPARSLVVAGDVLRTDDLRLMVETAMRRFRGLDVIVPCAGEIGVERFAEADGSLAERLLRVNCFGALETVRQCLPHVNRNGSVLFVTSALTRSGLPGLSAFQASQAALAAAARTLAVELAPQAIRVNCIAPGPTDTPAWKALGHAGEELLDRLHTRPPPARLLSPADVAELACFLASDAAQQIRGQEIILDGGQTNGERVL